MCFYQTPDWFFLADPDKVVPKDMYFDCVYLGDDLTASNVKYRRPDPKDHKDDQPIDISFGPPGKNGSDDIPLRTVRIYFGCSIRR